jgi:hypothetical protein
MKTIRPCVALSILALALAAAPLACGGTNNDEEEEPCEDCGPCGASGGLNDGPGVTVLDIGVDPSTNAATIEVRLEKDGKCPGEDGEFFWVNYGDGGSSTTERSAAGGLNTSKVIYNGITYTWTDRGLTMRIERVDAANVLFHFSQPGLARRVVCTAEDTGGIICAPQDLP